MNSVLKVLSQFLIAGLASLTLLMPPTAHAQAGSKLWEFPSGSDILSSPSLSASGTLYVGSYDQFLYAINSTNGLQRWKYSIAPNGANEAAYIFSSPAVAADGTIYFGTDHKSNIKGTSIGELYALNPNGTLKWVKSLAGSVYSDPAVGKDGTIYVGCYDTNFYAFNPDGTEKWRFRAADQIYSDGAIATDGTIYFGCDNGTLYALNPNGTKKWEYSTGIKAITASPAIGTDGAIYVGVGSAFNPKLFSISPSGTKNWEFVTGGQVNSSAAIGSDGTVYFGSSDHKLYALHPDGTKKWEFLTGDAVRSSPALASDGTVYLGSDDGKVYALDPNGAKLWEFPTLGQVYSSPAIGPDGTVYVGSRDGRLYALQGSSGLLVSSWPMFRHDLSRTARAAAGAGTNPTISDIPDQSVNEDTATGALPFTVGDVETTAGSLIVSASSSNPTLVPSAGLVLAGSGANRTLTVTPAANQSGTATITVTVTDGDGGTASDSFVLTVNSVNDLPIISDIPNQSIDEDMATGALAFTVGDLETPSASLTVSASSSKPALVPSGGLVMAGSGANRTLTVTPASNQSGTATITVTVTDADGGSASDSFVLTVSSVNDLPTISDISDQSVNEDTTTGALAFTVGDVETAATSLTVSVLSSKPALIPNSGLTLAGSGANRTLTVTPAANQSGTATITVTVTDGDGGTASDSFDLTSSALNDPPVLADIPTQAIYAGQVLNLDLTATDIDSPLSSLRYSLVEGPSGASVGPLTGQLSWTADEEEANTEQSITVQVSDDGLPPLSDSKTFKVTVLPRPVIQSILISDGKATLTWSSVKGKSYRVEYKSDLGESTWSALAGQIEAGGAVATKRDEEEVGAQRFYRIVALP